MAQRSKRPQKNAALPASPLDAKQRALQEQERKLHERMAKYEKLIEEAPKLAAARAKEQREELIRRAARTVKTVGNNNALPDRRYDANVGAPAQYRRMRGERRQGRLMFFILLLVLGLAVCYLYYTVTRG